MFKPTSFIKSLLVGSLLGDCFGKKAILKDGSQRAWFTFTQCTASKEYLFWLHKIFMDAKGTVVKKLEEQIFKDKRNVKDPTKTYGKYVFYTTRCEELVAIYDAFYEEHIIKDSDGKNKSVFKKRVPSKEFLMEYFEPISLAVWIADDGTDQKGYLKLCTDSFSILDLKVLQEVLKEKFDIDTLMHCAGNKDKNGNLILHQNRLQITGESMPRLIELIKDVYPPSMRYKFGWRQHHL